MCLYLCLEIDGGDVGDGDERALVIGRKEQKQKHASIRIVIVVYTYAACQR